MAESTSAILAKLGVSISNLAPVLTQETEIYSQEAPTLQIKPGMNFGNELAQMLNASLLPPSPLD